MKGFTSKILHGDLQGGTEHGAIHKPIHASVTWAHKTAEDLADTFQGKRKAYAYGRQSNPTVDALCKIITEMDAGVVAVAITFFKS